MELRSLDLTKHHALGPVPLASTAAHEEVYVFDIATFKPCFGSTLEAAFAEHLAAWAHRKPCYLTSSRGYHHIIQVVPKSVRQAVRAIFANGGADVWCDDICQSRASHVFDDSVLAFVSGVARHSAFPEKRLPVLEAGPGTLSLDLAGHGASRGQRERYESWNQTNHEMTRFVREFSERFPAHRIYWEDATRLVISHADASARSIADHLRKTHPDGRLLAYFASASTRGYAAGLSDALQARDMLARAENISDISQFLAYETQRDDDHAPAAIARPMRSKEMVYV